MQLQGAYNKHKNKNIVVIIFHGFNSVSYLVSDLQQREIDLKWNIHLPYSFIDRKLTLKDMIINFSHLLIHFSTEKWTLKKMYIWHKPKHIKCKWKIVIQSFTANKTSFIMVRSKVNKKNNTSSSPSVGWTRNVSCSTGPHFYQCWCSFVSNFSCGPACQQCCVLGPEARHASGSFLRSWYRTLGTLSKRKQPCLALAWVHLTQLHSSPLVD